MVEEFTDPQEDNTPSFSPRLYTIAAVVGCIIVAGIWLVSRFASIDLARDMQSWQEKLNLVAESRVAEVDGFLSQHTKELRSLADNPSLQLYMTELQTMNPEKSSGDESAQKTYLRNLLLFTADRAGYADGALAGIRANVTSESKSGLAVLNNRNEIVVSTNMTSEMRDAMLAQTKQLPRAKESILDLQKDKDGDIYMGFVAPIYSIQGEHEADAQIGLVVGIKSIDGNLFGLLKHPGTTEETLETILVRKADKKIEFISPLLDGSEAMSKQIDPDRNKFAEVGLMETTGNFITDKKDYRDKPVLATSRNIAAAPWALVVKIDRAEALGESSERRASMVVVLFLVIAVVVLIIVAVWWHAHSRRAMMMSYHFRQIAAQARAQERLLRLVADHQPEPIYILDTTQTYQFANQKAGEEVGMDAARIQGKTLNDVRGSARADQIGESCDKALSGRQILYETRHIDSDLGERVIRSAYVPLEHIPIAYLPDPTPGVLVVDQDISEVVHERERRLDTHRQLVHTLLRLVDQRDPFAANHSLLVSQLAHEVAVEMDLNNAMVETARFAGSLMNIGKIVVPTELLTKTESLTDDEKRIIRDSMNAAADIIQDVSFDGPVSETLRQWQEKWDGSGPLGMTGESILISARIIAVANAFVGMISPRSWRHAIPIESANKFLMDQCGMHFDRRVVVALVNYVENHHGRKWIDEVLKIQRDAA